MKDIWSSLFSKRKGKTVLEILSEVSLFEDIPRRQLRAIEQIGHIRDFKPKEKIFRRGEPAYGIYIILKGSVAIFAGRKRIFIHMPYDLFGESALIRDSMRDATAVSQEQSVLFYIPSAGLRGIFKSYPKMGLKIYEKALSTIYAVIERYEEALCRQS